MTTHASTSVLLGLNSPAPREKLFGAGKPKPLSRHEKVNLTRKAREMRRANEPGKHITRADVDVFMALLWGFHNAVTGLCFPSYEAIAETAGCARSTVYEAIKRLEAASLLTWVNRLKRRYERVIDMFGEGIHGQRSWVERTSNGYQFVVPPDVESSKSENSSGTEGQESFSSLATPVPAEKPVDPGLDAALMRLGSATRSGPGRAAL